MGYARSLTVPQDAGGIYHCYSRCVRKERLLESPQRIAVLERRLCFLSTRVFAIDLIEFKPMGNHVHGIVRTHPELAWCWTDEEVARRWLLLSMAGRMPDLDAGDGPSDAAVAALAQKKPRIEELRRRLADLGSYHSAWKEWSAKRWNREDRVSGHFWQGRYGVTTALDDGAVLTQSIYVLLNAVHAGLENELGTKTPGSLKTRIERLLRKATEDARAEAFDREFVHASWTPCYPCDPGSAAELDDEEYARRVAAGRHRASFRRSLREEAMALAHFASAGESEEVERAARALRGEGDDEARNVEPAEPSTPGQRRPRPTNVPRHRTSSARAMAPRAELKPDERAWLRPWPNPFLRSRLVDGAVPVVTGVTLGMLIGLADAEGRHPRPDKPGVIAKDAEPAIASMQRAFAKGAVTNEPSAERMPEGTWPLRESDAAATRSLAVARELACALRQRVIERMARGGVTEAGWADPPGRQAIRMRGTAAGTRESLREEAIRRGRSCVHQVTPQIRE